jgi:hypothetical protein
VVDLDSCSVCGRTILSGERPRIYLDTEGEKRNVCELCRARAEQLGWVWEELVDGRRPDEPRRRRRGGLAALLRRNGRRDSVEEEQPEAVEGAVEEREDEAAEEERPEAEEAEATAAEPAAARRERREVSPDPAGRGADVVRRLPAEPQASPLERAVERFNVSEQAYTVGGLMRTLGPPWVSVGTAAGSPGEIRITVAWELSWYQWGVDLRDEGRPVYEIDKGYEIDQLDAAARHWNAQAEADGRLRLGAPDWSQEAEEAEEAEE